MYSYLPDKLTLSSNYSTLHNLLTWIMKQLLLSIFLASSVNAQSYNWKFVDVRNNNDIVGHIYHTESIGRQAGATPEKVSTGLRLVCSNKEKDTNEPLLILYWNGMFGNTPADVTIKVDDRQIGVGQTYSWTHDGPVIHRTVRSSGEILRAMKIGRIISFSWVGNNGIQRTAMFDLRTFKQNINSFNTACKTNI